MIQSRTIDLTDWQAVMSCHFDVKGVRKESIRYPQTWVKKINEESYSLRIKSGSLSEFLPGRRLIACAYKLILIGKNTETKRLAIGDIFFIGEEFGEMSDSEISDIKNKKWVAKVLREKMDILKLAVDTNGSIISE